MTERELAAFVCSHIYKATRPVLLVARENGDWMFLCGHPHSKDEEYETVGRDHLVERDSSLTEVLNLPDNTEAERTSVSDAWQRRPLSDE